MTDGTSQGLFIVVATVIFGIFVALSYTVFGDVLAGGTVNIFDSAIEEVEDIQLDRKAIFRESNVSASSEGRSTIENYQFPAHLFEQDGSYTIVFDIEVLSGELASIRGHLHSSTNPRLFINGVEHVHPTTTWRVFSTGLAFDEPFKEGETVRFELVFDANRYDNPLQHTNPFVSIEPNQHMSHDGYRQIHNVTTSINYRNIRLIKH